MYCFEGACIPDRRPPNTVIHSYGDQLPGLPDGEDPVQAAEETPEPIKNKEGSNWSDWKKTGGCVPACTSNGRGGQLMNRYCFRMAE